MSSSQKRKGYRIEHQLVVLLKQNGINAKRVPLSGAQKDFSGDVIINDEMIGEVKARRSSFKSLYKWLTDRDVLFVKADRKPFLVVMPLEVFIKLVGGGK